MLFKTLVSPITHKVTTLEKEKILSRFIVKFITIIPPLSSSKEALCDLVPKIVYQTSFILKKKIKFLSLIVTQCSHINE